MSSARSPDPGAARFPACGEVLLNGEARAWRIEYGAVDIFSVWLRDEAPGGAREPLMRLEAGRSFCGLRSAGGDVGLIAVASADALLTEISPRADRGPAPAWFSEWLYDLETAAGRPGGRPRNADLAETDAGVLAQISAGREQQDTETVERMAQRARTDERVFGEAIEELARVLGDPDHDTPVLVRRSGDALADACRQVFLAAGIRPAPGAAEGASTLERVERLARQAGVAWRAVELEGGAWWTEDSGPLLAFRRGGAPVALIPRRRGGLWLIDPAADTSARLDAEAAAGLEFTAYAFYPALRDEPVGLLELLRFSLRGTGPDLRRLLGLGAVGGVLGLGVPMATGFLINTIVPADDVGELWQVVLLLLTTTIGVSAFELSRAVALLRIDARMTSTAQAAIMQRVLRLPTSFFRDFAAGDLTQRIFGVAHILRLASQTAQTALVSWIFGLASFAYLFVIEWRLGLLVSALVFVALAVTVGFNLLRLRLERRLLEAQGEIASRVFQILTGIGKLRANGAERRAFSLWASRFARQKRLDFGIRRVANGLEVFNSGYVVLASLCLFGAVAVLTPDMPTGSFAAFNAAFSQFFAATMALTLSVTASLQVIPLYERSRPILNALPEPNRVPAAPHDLTGAIDLSHVTFRYDEQGPPILDDLSLSIRPGEFVAVVGPSASGKSTLFRLLLGFERPQTGAVYYDGLDLAGLDVAGVRRQLGVVLQNGKLTPGALYENIIGAAQMSLDDAWAADLLAGLEADIQAMPMGLHTLVSEGAATISGGQRQRLMIARAVAGRPRILLFDEATSALDNTSQAQVTKSLKSLDATRIVIAHRLSTIVEADRILVLEAGRLVETGRYEELMARNGRFAALARRQIT